MDVYYKFVKQTVIACRRTAALQQRSRAMNSYGQFFLPADAFAGVDLPDEIQRLVGDSLQSQGQRFVIETTNQIVAEDELAVDTVDVNKLPGMAIYNRLVAAIDLLYRRPHDVQIDLIIGGFQIYLPLIFDGRTDKREPLAGEITDWDMYKEQICRRIGIKDIDEAIPVLGRFVSTPRRFGKTEFMAMLVSLLLICVPRISILAISTNLNISNMFVERVAGYLSAIPEAQARVIAQNKSEITLAPWDNDRNRRNMFSTLKALTSSTNGNRGQGARVIVFDEGAFGDDNAMINFVWPLLQQENVKLFCISSPAVDENSFFAQIIRKYAGSKLVSVFVFESVCRDCARQDKDTCPHTVDFTPPWISSESARAAGKIIKELDSAAYFREFKGATEVTDIPGFPAELITKAFGANSNVYYSVPEKTRWRPLTVFMSIDPSGGGDASNVGLVSFFVDDSGNMVVSSWQLCRCVES